jgi:hypothetical protein
MKHKTIKETLMANVPPVWQLSKKRKPVVKAISGAGEIKIGSPMADKAFELISFFASTLRLKTNCD